jgi:hypothetical protein
MRPMRQPIQQRRCHSFITKHAIPIRKTQIRGDNNRDFFIQL